MLCIEHSSEVLVIGPDLCDLIVSQLSVVDIDDSIFLAPLHSDGLSQVVDKEFGKRQLFF